MCYPARFTRACKSNASNIEHFYTLYKIHITVKPNESLVTMPSICLPSNLDVNKLPLEPHIQKIFKVKRRVEKRMFTI